MILAPAGITALTFIVIILISNAEVTNFAVPATNDTYVRLVRLIRLADISTTFGTFFTAHDVALLLPKTAILTIQWWDGTKVRVPRSRGHRWHT
jgi:hypothetical protein